MKNKINIAIKSFLAGCAIGIGGLIYLSISDKIIGALLFSFGLITIIAKGYLLYTGKIAYITFKQWFDYLIILIFNIIGASLIGKIAQLLDFNTENLIQAKLSFSFLHLFIASIICGILMYLGVSLTALTNNIIYAIIAVMIFILTGSEHCIANAFYFSVSNQLLESWRFFIINIVGNSIGAIFLYRLEYIGCKLSITKGK